MESCPICSGPLTVTGISSPDRQFGHDGTFTISECRSCDLGATMPYLDEGQISRYYSGGYGEYGISRSRLRTWHRQRRLNRAPFSALGRPGRLLDVGCASGQIGSELIARGWQVSGVDPDPGAVEQAVSLGLDARVGDIAAFANDPAGFDAVLFHHSLEHVPDPVDALRQAGALVSRANGQVVVAVPNWEAPLRRLFKGDWFQLDVPRHRWHYSTGALQRAAEAAGLRADTVGTTAAIESLLGSLQYKAFGRRRITGKPFFLAMLALTPMEPVLGRADTAFMVASLAYSPAGEAEARMKI